MKGNEMKVRIHKIKKPLAALSLRGGRLRRCGYASFLTGMTLTAVLGLMSTLPMPSFAHAEDGGATPTITTITTTALVNDSGGASVKTSETGTEDEDSEAIVKTFTSRVVAFTTSKTSTIRGKAIGVLVSRTGDGDVTFTNESGIESIKEHGIKAVHSSAGELNIINNGRIKNVGQNGIDVTHFGGVTANPEDNDSTIKIGLTGNIEAANRAINALHKGTGNIEFSANSSSITGSREGVYAKHTGSGGIVINTNTEEGSSGGGIISSGRGIFARHEGSNGDIDVTVVRAAGILSRKGDGIFTERVGTGIGSSTILTLDSTISGRDTGISVSHANGSEGDIHIFSTSKITGGDKGIFARHKDNGSINIGNLFSSLISTEGVGVIAEHFGTGDIGVGVYHSGKISAHHAGVSALHAGSGSVTLYTDPGTAISAGGDGMLVKHTGTGDISVDSYGTIDANHTGISVLDKSSNNNINFYVGGDISARQAGVSYDYRDNDKMGYGNNLRIKVSPRGSVSGDSVGIRLAAKGFTEIYIAGRVSSANGNAIEINDKENLDSRVNVYLLPGFSLGGDVVSTGTSPVLYLFSSFSTWNTPRSGLLNFSTGEFRGFNSLFKYSENLWVLTGEMSEDGAFQTVGTSGGLRFSDVDFKMAKDSPNAFEFFGDLEIAGSNRLRGSLRNGGRLVFMSEGKDDLLTITGNYKTPETYGGELAFRVNPNKPDSYGWDDDKLVIEGNFIGPSPTRVSIITPETSYPLPALPSSPVLIEVKGEAQTDDFQGEQVVGPYRYVLGHEATGNVNKWRFHKRSLSSATAPLSLMVPMLSELSKTPTPNSSENENFGLGFREGFRGHGEGIWAEQQSSRTSLNPHTITGSRSRMEDNRVHFGFNIPATSLVGGDVLLGASMSQSFLTSDVFSSIGNGSIGVESHAATLTTSWWSPKGFYTDGQARYVRFLSDISAERLSLVQDNEGTGVSASAELGYRSTVPLGGMDFQIAPQAQLVWSRVGFDSFVGPHGELVSLEDGDLLTGRLGISWDSEWQGAGGAVHIYGGMNLRGALDGRTAVDVSGILITSKQDLSVDGHLGVSYEWDGDFAVYGEAVALHRDDTEEIRANLGVSVNF